MFTQPSLLRHAELKAFSKIELKGKVLDLGGVKNSAYFTSFKGNFVVTTVNMDTKTDPDIIHNLEFPLPINNEEYDHVLLINVIEHIFEYRHLLNEIARVLSKKGSAIIVAPFMFPFHPSPEDYHRFTKTALQLELEKVGLGNIKIITMGSGAFSAVYLFVDRLLPRFLRFFSFYTLRYLAGILDLILLNIARILGKKYSSDDYALGYCVIAQKTE